MNPCLCAISQSLNVMFLNLQTMQDFTEIQDSAIADISRDLATIHQLCATHLDDLKKLPDTQFSQVCITLHMKYWQLNVLG